MAGLENIPYVFELARIHRGSKKISLTFEEYNKYSKIYEELSESVKKMVIAKVNENVFVEN
jgi:fibronectin type 3 domain-containing protein